MFQGGSRGSSAVGETSLRPTWGRVRRALASLQRRLKKAEHIRDSDRRRSDSDDLHFH